MPTKKVVIVEDHPIFSKGLRQLITALGGYEILGEATDGVGAKRAIGSSMPDLVIVDQNLVTRTGLFSQGSKGFVPAFSDPRPFDVRPTILRRARFARGCP